MLDFLVIWLHSLVWISFHLLAIRARDKYQHCDKGGTFFFYIWALSLIRRFFRSWTPWMVSHRTRGIPPSTNVKAANV